MDSIKAIKGFSPHMGDREHLSIYVNGERLDAILAKNTDESYLGLVPAWLDDYDEDFPPSLKEKQYVWEQTKLESGTKIVPLMLCPDDFDFSCTTIVVEVIDSGESVIWNRFGADVTDFDADETELPKYIGKKIRWFSNIKPFVFVKNEYLECINAFSKREVTMKVDEIKEILKRKAVIFHTGGKRPEKELLESWIGSVSWKQQAEDWPLDGIGKKMLPIATIFLKGIPFCPVELLGIELVTIFMSEEVWDNLIAEDLSPWFTIRTYKSLDDLVPCEYISGLMNPFPIFPELVEDDFPAWDGGGIPSEIEDIILKLENTDGIDYFEDICEEIYGQHKIGGYPAFCQSGHWFGDDYAFVLQISSDEKAGFNIVDSGSFYFYYNPRKADWKVYCDFY